MSPEPARHRELRRGGRVSSLGPHDLPVRSDLSVDILDYAGVSKVVFGTDNPIFNTVQPTRNWIQLIKNLPNNAPKGIAFTEAEVVAILGGNAAAILNLNETAGQSY